MRNFFGGTLSILTATLLVGMIVIGLPVFLCAGGCAVLVGMDE